MKNTVQTMYLALGISTACERPSLTSDPTSSTDLSAVEQSGPTVCNEQGTRVINPYRAVEMEGALADIEAQEDTGLSGEWGLAVADFDGDDHLDIYLPRFGTGSLLLGDGTGDFLPADENRIPDVELDYSHLESYTMGVVSVDVNADGYIDIVESSVGTPTILINDGHGFFTDETIALGLNIASGMDFNTAWADYDLDGDLDLYIPMYPSEDPTPEQIEAGGYVDGVAGVLMENLGADGFVDRSDLLPSQTNDGHPFAAGWHDLDGDLHPELVIANDHGREIRSNRVWRFDGERFVDVSTTTGIDSALDSMGLGVGDLNRDGLPDLVFTGWAEFSLLESIGGDRWIDTVAARDLYPRESDHQVGWGVEMADMDNDGHLDIMALFGQWENLPESMDDYDNINPANQPDTLYRQRQDGSFEEVAAAWGLAERAIGRGLVLADINEDGWLDVVRRHIFDDPTVHVSTCGDEAWLIVEIDDSTTANTQGVGARIEVRVGEDSWTDWLHAGGTSIASSGPVNAHFGLGPDITIIDELTVAWPDGTVSTFADIPARQTITVLR